jgi:UDP-N-acetylglucosamine 4,6-dehydratase/5-epimerase
MFKDKILLITGGTGSFGNAMLKRLLSSNIGEIRIFSRDEKKQDDMRKHYSDNRIRFYIGDVRDKESVDTAVKGADFIFHAAALKQVPSCEFFPIQAVKTNILGSNNVMESAINHKVSKVIILSTDKAVYPINAMGMSKAMMELVMLAKAREVGNIGTVFCGTRYGNVMASRGSVIPLFIDLIKKKKPLTITDPNMTRFMMTLEDAVELVMYAFKKGKQGDRFIQKAPAATINDLADALSQLYNSKSSIKTIGTRHGEKLYESLVNREEMALSQDLGEYYRIPIDDRDLNYDSYFTEGNNEISRVEEYTSHNTKRLNVDEIKDLLLKLGFINSDISDKEIDIRK